MNAARLRCVPIEVCVFSAVTVSIVGETRSVGTFLARPVVGETTTVNPL
jgi:hypothetical protein